jgi:microcompartment protein CcmK/EutM
MKRGLVVGEVWATRKAPGLEGRSLKLVVEYPEPEKPSPAALSWAPLVVAIDTLDTRCGQEVLVAYGSGARNVLAPGPDNRTELCDAAVALLPEDNSAGQASDPGHAPGHDTQPTYTARQG